MKLRWFTLALCCGCGALTPPQVDGGAGGGVGTLGGGTGFTGGGVGITGGGSGVTGGGVGTTGGGTTTLGGGTGTTGGGGGETWSFGAGTLNTVNTNSGTMVGLAQNAAGLWALSSNSRLFLATDAGFDEQVRLTQLSEPFYPLSFRSDATGRLFFVSTVWIGWCDSGCTDNSNWNYEQIQDSATTLSDAGPAPGGKVVAIGTQGSNNDGVAYLLSGGTFSSSPTAVGVTRPRRCWVANSGEMLIAADNAIAHYDGSGFSSDATDPVTWGGGASVPGHDWAFASGPEVGEGPSWSVTTVGTNIHNIYAAVQASPTLTWGFGGSNLSSPQILWKFDGTNWSAATPDLSGFKLVNAALKTGDGTLYFAGTGPDDRPAIGRGVRR